MALTLQLVFQNQLGRNALLSIPEVREDVTPAEIKTLMELIVAKNIFETSGGDLVALMEANLVSREVQEISVR